MIIRVEAWPWKEFGIASTPGGPVPQTPAPSSGTANNSAKPLTQQPDAPKATAPNRPRSRGAAGKGGAKPVQDEEPKAALTGPAVRRRRNVIVGGHTLPAEQVTACLLEYETWTRVGGCASVLAGPASFIYARITAGLQNKVSQ